MASLAPSDYNYCVITPYFVHLSWLAAHPYRANQTLPKSYLISFTRVAPLPLDDNPKPILFLTAQILATTPPHVSEMLYTSLGSE